jgi:hypothetical protein
MKKAMIALVVLMISSFAVAQTRIVTVDAFDLSYSGGLSFTKDKKASGSDDRDTSHFRLNLNYAQNWDQYVGVMWKGEFHFNREDVDFKNNDSLQSTFGAAGGFIYNFNAEDIKNSFLASAMVGLERMTIKYGSDDNSGFNFSLKLEGGKRFDLGQYSVANISYAPTIALTLKRYGGDIRDEFFKSSRELAFHFLKFDILF